MYIIYVHTASMYACVHIYGCQRSGNRRVRPSGDEKEDRPGKKRETSHGATFSAIKNFNRHSAQTLFTRLLILCLKGAGGGGGRGAGVGLKGKK